MASTEAAEGLGYGWAILLGAIQGVTEFLPVSSSGHLALAEHLGRGVPEHVAFDILLHLATLVVIVGAFRKEFVGFWRNDRIVLGYLVVGSVPIGVVGVFFRAPLEAIRREPLAVCVALLVTAGALVVAERVRPPRLDLRRLGLGGSLTVGLCQALAIVPGVSRSGLTITGGLLRGLRREEAVAFSFLLMVPAVLGAAVLTGIREPEGFLSLPVGPALAGFAAATLTGYGALRLLIRVVRREQLVYFAVYCAVAAVGGGIYFLVTG